MCVCVCVGGGGGGGGGGRGGGVYNLHFESEIPKHDNLTRT